jgi:hypothetical protein
MHKYCEYIRDPEEEPARNYLKEAAIFIPIFLVGICVVGKLADTFLASEEKAEEARKLNYDV